MKHLCLSTLSVLFVASVAQGAIEIKDESQDRRYVTSTKYKTAADGISLREIRKVGFGMKTAGVAGMLGLALELNFSPEVSFSTGWGIGDGYQTLHFQLKKTLLGRRFLPYIAGGLARWYSVGEGRVSGTSPSFLGKKFLNGKERRTGVFAENIIYPAAGIQFLQIDGEWAGFSIYAEALVLVDLDDLAAEPSPGLGMTYYF